MEEIPSDTESQLREFSRALAEGYKNDPLATNLFIRELFIRRIIIEEATKRERDSIALQREVDVQARLLST